MSEAGEGQGSFDELVGHPIDKDPKDIKLPQNVSKHQVDSLVTDSLNTEDKISVKDEPLRAFWNTEIELFRKKMILSECVREIKRLRVKGKDVEKAEGKLINTICRMYPTQTERNNLLKLMAEEGQKVQQELKDLEETDSFKALENINMSYRHPRYSTLFKRNVEIYTSSEFIEQIDTEEFEEEIERLLINLKNLISKYLNSTEGEEKNKLNSAIVEIKIRLRSYGDRLENSYFKELYLEITKPYSEKVQKEQDRIKSFRDKYYIDKNRLR